MEKLSYSSVPFNWTVCFQADCPLAATCLRHAAGKLVPARVAHHNTVLTSARQGNSCRLFVPNELQRVAHGMWNLFTGINPWDASRIRQRLFKIFGSRSQFYRYYSGRYPITPEQQEQVAEVFRQFGFHNELTFDHVTEEYYFPAP